MSLGMGRRVLVPAIRLDEWSWKMSDAIFVVVVDTECNLMWCRCHVF